MKFRTWREDHHEYTIKTMQRHGCFYRFVPCLLFAVSH